MKKLLNFLLASLLVFVVFFWNPTERSVEKSPLDFQITTVNGEFFLKDLHKKQNVILFFGYTFCPDICPTTLLELSAALSQLPPEKLESTAVFFVTLDPKRDTPHYLQEYATFFHPKITGAVAENLPKMAAAFKVQFRQNPEPPFLIDHTADIVVIPKHSKIFTMPFGTSAAEILKTLKEKL